MIKQRVLNQLKAKLEDRRDQLLDQIESLEEELAFLDQSRPPEFSEEAQEEAAANSLLALDEKERKELTDIANALEKLEEGTYGKCERCSKEITEQRLTALPMVRYCISCQKRIEQRSR